MDKLLRVENLNKDKILHQVSFEMKQGEMLAVMGPSGSGKSTLLYNVSGMDQPTGGKVWLGDTEITGLSEDAQADLRLHQMGFIFQQMNMIANLNILDNILLPVMQANKGKGGKSKSELMAEAKGGCGSFPFPNWGAVRSRRFPADSSNGRVSAGAS